MKKITDYKEEIHKCSKCGLCQSVCPVYQVTGNDCAVSRGKFIMLNGIIKGDLELNANINKYLDMCLKCNACKDFCPSGIDARTIFLAAKSQYFEKSSANKFVKLFHSKFIFNSFLNLVGICLNIYRFLKFDKFIKNFYNLLLKFKLGEKIILANEFIQIPSCHAECVSASNNQSILDRSRNEFKMSQDGNSLTKVVYFKGCVNEYINPRTKNAVEEILRRLNVNILQTKFECCGMPFLSSGNVEQFKKQAIFNISQIPDDFDYFLTDCASCQSSFKEYAKYIDDSKLLEKLERINAKSINVVDFIIKNINNIEFNNETTFTFHKPCHLEDMSFLQDFLKKTKNLRYIQMEDFDKCCGFSGEFALKNQQISEQISSQKAKNALATKADYIVTTCPACNLGLIQGSIIENNIISPLNLVELLLLAEKIC